MVRQFRRIVEAMKVNEGLIQTSDFAAYQVKERTPIEEAFRGHRILSFPHPLPVGFTWYKCSVCSKRVASLAQTPSTFDIDGSRPCAELTKTEPATWAIRILPCPAGGSLVPKPPRGFTAIDQKGGRYTESDLNNPQLPRRSERTQGGSEGNPHHETSHLSVLDRRGNAVSLTFTINTTFGAAVMALGTGVIFNNEMDDFSAKPGVPNAYGLVYIGQCDRTGQNTTLLHDPHPRL